MKCSFPRRIAAIGSIAAVFAVIVTGAFAAELSPNAASLPSKNPIDLKMANGTAWTQQLSAAAYTNRTVNFTDQWGSSVDDLVGNLTISKQSGDNVTITITSMDSGLIIPNAMVTVSGGQTGATKIMSTAISSNLMKYTIKLTSHEGTPPQLNIKWYTSQLVM